MRKKQSQITTVNESQLNLLSTEEKTALTYHENVIEKGLETFIEVGQSLQYIRDNRLYRSDFTTFDDYMSDRWGKSRAWASNMIKSVDVINSLESVNPGLQKPETEKVARPLAKLKNDPELMAQVWEEAVAEAKLQYEAGLKKSDQPTHKEVEAKVKEYEDKINQLKTELADKQKEAEDAKQGELFFQKKLNEKVTENYNLIETIENQNKQIKELNSDISAKENALSTLNTQRADLDLLSQELDEKIAKEANIIAQETLEKERKTLANKEADLTAKQQEIEKQLKEAKAIKNKATKEKENLTDISDWIRSINDFNEVLKQQKDHVMATLRRIQQVPNLDVLEQSDKEIVNKKIDSVISDFHDNTEAFGMALNKVHLAIKKFDNTVLKTLGVARGKTVEVEVLNDE